MSAGWVRTIAVTGHSGGAVAIHATTGEGSGGLVIAGVPDPARTLRDRVYAATRPVAGKRWPTGQITVTVMPAWRSGTVGAPDAAIAVAILAVLDVIPAHTVAETAVMGEVGIDGSFRPIEGTETAARIAASARISRMIVPAANALEAHQAVAGRATAPAITAVDSLRDVVATLSDERPAVAITDGPRSSPRLTPPDVASTEIPLAGRAAVMLAAAGGHHVAFIAPPSAGTRLLAEQLPVLLPPLPDADRRTLEEMGSRAGGPNGDRTPPFVAPPVSATAPDLLCSDRQPGAVSLAHAGVLFLNDAPEFSPNALDAVTAVLDHEEARLLTSAGPSSCPGRVQLVATARPCPCGDTCRCRAVDRRRYLDRLHRLLGQRVPIVIRLDDGILADWRPFGIDRWDSTADLRAQAATARDRALARWKPHGWTSNHRVPNSALTQGPFRPPSHAREPIQNAVDRGALSDRGATGVLQLAWTIADIRALRQPDRAAVELAIDLSTRWQRT